MSLKMTLLVKSHKFQYQVHHNSIWALKHTRKSTNVMSITFLRNMHLEASLVMRTKAGKNTTKTQRKRICLHLSQIIQNPIIQRMKLVTSGDQIRKTFAIASQKKVLSVHLPKKVWYTRKNYWNPYKLRTNRHKKKKLDWCSRKWLKSLILRGAWRQTLKAERKVLVKKYSLPNVEDLTDKNNQPRLKACWISLLYKTDIPSQWMFCSLNLTHKIDLVNFHNIEI